MKEFVSIVSAFLVVVGFSFYMYVSNQKDSISRLENKEIQELVKQNHEDLKREIEELRNHIQTMDSIYHKQ
jgi:hypothetical protein